MLETLPLVLFIVLAELAIGSFCVMFALDWRNQVKRSFLVTYGLIYILLTGLTYVFQQYFSTPEFLNTFTHIDKGWTAYLNLPMLLFLILMVPYNVFLFMDKNAGVDGKEKTSQSWIRVARLISGGLCTLAGLVALFVMGMIYSQVATTSVGAIFTVAGFFAGALALGGVMTAMWLGHWYLVTPALSEKPLLFATTLVLIGVLAQLIFTFTSGTMIPSTPTSSSSSRPAVTATATTGQTTTPPNVKPANAITQAPLSAEQVNWFRILISFILPLILGGLAWKLVRDRSFQSATGMLYLVVCCTLAGEAIARGLFLMGLG